MGISTVARQSQVIVVTRFFEAIHTKVFLCAALPILLPLARNRVPERQPKGLVRQAAVVSAAGDLPAKPRGCYTMKDLPERERRVQTLLKVELTKRNLTY